MPTTRLYLTQRLDLVDHNVKIFDLFTKSSYLFAKELILESAAQLFELGLFPEINFGENTSNNSKLYKGHGIKMNGLYPGRLIDTKSILLPNGIYRFDSLLVSPNNKGPIHTTYYPDRSTKKEFVEDYLIYGGEALSKIKLEMDKVEGHR